MTMTPDVARGRIEGWFREALHVVEPRGVVSEAMTWSPGRLMVGDAAIDVGDRAQVVVLAIGKAASAMAAGAHDVLGARIDQGIVLTKDGHIDSQVDGFDYFEASHPIPDDRGVAATRSILEVVDGLTDQDLVIALISGGGSALLESPREPLSLDDLQQITKTVMHAGAGIHELNAVRRRLSEVKAGGLRRHLGGARCISLLLSDVLGNDPQVIASGPTIIQGDEGLDAVDVLQQLGVADDMPSRAMELLLGPLAETTHVDASSDVWEVIADNQALVNELRRLVEAEGLLSDIRPNAWEGDAVELGRDLVRDAREASAETDVLIGGGEATVEVRGDGRGGRNTEAALAAAVELDPDDRWVIASLASDGDDGAADAAGAVAGPTTVTDGSMMGLNVNDYLANNDSATYFRKVGGLVETGPTGTNVNDIYIALRLRGMGE